MHDVLKERVWRRIQALPQEQVYQVLDYVEFLEAKYAKEKAHEPDVLQKFAERVEDSLRMRSVAPKVISGTVGLLGSARRVMRTVSDAGRDILGTPPDTTARPPSNSQRNTAPRPASNTVRDTAAGPPSDTVRETAAGSTSNTVRDTASGPPSNMVWPWNTPRPDATAATGEASSTGESSLSGAPSSGDSSSGVVPGESSTGEPSTGETLPRGTTEEENHGTR